MTCQHCQTWIGDDEHRCPRCGRRARTFPGRISPSTYPIAATATAPAYDFAPPDADARQREPEPRQAEVPIANGQQVLFSQPVNPPRVIAFDSLTSPSERESIRARAAERPPPLKTGKVELPRPQRAKREGRSAAAHNQQSLEFVAPQEAVAGLTPSLICDAPVASAGLRAQAAVRDGLFIAVGCAALLAAYRIAGGPLTMEKSQIAFLAAAVLTVPVFYKLMWVFVGVDSPGTRQAHLRVVDFDGNPPSRQRRYLRLAGSFLSVLAAGIGVLWSFVDEDKLMWHDHISSTFPTPVDE